MSADQKEKEHPHEHNPLQDSNQESFINKKISSNRVFKVRSTAVDCDSESEGLNSGSSEPATFNEDEDTRNAERSFKNNECDASSVDTASTSTVSTDGCNCNGIACSGLKCLAATTLAAVLKSVLPENDAALKSADLARTEQINTELFDPLSQETVDLVVGTDITPERRLSSSKMTKSENGATDAAPPPQHDFAADAVQKAAAELHGEFAERRDVELQQEQLGVKEDQLRVKREQLNDQIQHSLQALEESVPQSQPNGVSSASAHDIYNEGGLIASKDDFGSYYHFICCCDFDIPSTPRCSWMRGYEAIACSGSSYPTAVQWGSAEQGECQEATHY